MDHDSKEILRRLRAATRKLTPMETSILEVLERKDRDDREAAEEELQQQGFWADQMDQDEEYIASVTDEAY